MLIGVPKEIKVHEYRVGLVPASVHELVVSGHAVLVQSGAGVGLGISDSLYESAGATIVDSAADVFEKAEMIVKVKELQAEERKRLRRDQVLFTYLHLAPDPEQTKELLASGAVCIAYETVTSALGGLPLLAPMSEVAGRMAIQAGAHCLEKEQGGMGTLLCGVPGVAPGKIVIIGGGVVGANATKVAVGIGAEVVVIDRSNEVLRHLDEVYGSSIKTIFSTIHAIEHHVLSADLVIGAVLIPGAAAPKLITSEMVGQMKQGSVIVDVAIDQGGCSETSHPTTHADPTYIVHDVVHYCVANMPGAVARTSTFALNNATLPFVRAIADKGYRQAILDDPHLRNGLNVHGGKITCEGVATALGYEFVDPLDTLGA
jgi:alanine dehydrogenase